MSKGGDTSTKESRLPLTFDVQPSISTSKQSYPLSITLIRNLKNLVLDNLPNRSFSETKQIFKLAGSIDQALGSFSGQFFFAKIQKRSTDKDWKAGIVYHISKQIYGIINIPKDINYKSITSHTSEMIRTYKNVEDFKKRATIEVKSQNISTDAIAIIDKFTMFPPINGNLDKQTTILDSPQSHEDPLSFLYSRYYNILYLLNNPLIYFPKTGLTRFKNLCNNDNGIIKSNLTNLYISVDELDERHLGKFGVLTDVINSRNNSNNLAHITSDINLKANHERENQINYLKKNDNIYSKINYIGGNDDQTDAKILEKISSTNLELKIREAQLQILVLLELLLVSEISEEEFFKNNLKRENEEIKKRNKQAKQSLVRKKNAKGTKKVIPTFLGMGVNLEVSNQDSASKIGKIDHYILYTTLNTLIDRIGLWDTLLGRNNSSKNDSSYGYLAYVVVPYYNKRLPETVKHIVEKVKGSNLKLVSKNKRSEQNNKGSFKTQENSKILTSSSSAKERDENSNRPSKFNKISHRGMPSLKRSSLTQSNDLELLPSFMLKRSKSSLSSKNLQKRQVDMSLSTKSFSEGQSSTQKSNNIHKSSIQGGDQNQSQALIFGNAKKSASNLTSKSVAQVDATPTKNRQRSFNFLNDSALYKTSSESIVIKTPENKYANSKTSVIVPERVPSITESIMRASNNFHNNEHIISSPEVYKFGIKANTKANPSSLVIDSSPIKQRHETPAGIVQSSPSSIRSYNSRNFKPGQPASIQDSPFFNSNFGSPVSLKVKKDYAANRSEYNFQESFES